MTTLHCIDIICSLSLPPLILSLRRWMSCLFPVVRLLFLSPQMSSEGKQTLIKGGAEGKGDILEAFLETL